MCSRLVQKICAQVEMKAKELGVLGQGLYANVRCVYLDIKPSVTDLPQQTLVRASGH